MFCRKCGKSIPDDSVFCPYCGETVKSDEPEKKGHGYCSNCGAPLPAGKITGLCDSCMSKADIDTAEYGRCENCGVPLEADDSGMLCKKCIEKRFGDYSQPLVNSPIKKSHKGAIAGGIIVSVFAIIILAAIGNSKTGVTQAAAQSSQTAVGSSSTIVANAAVPAISSATPDSSTVPDLELLSDSGTFDTDISTIHITGKIKNNTKKTLSYVEVQFALYDKSGSQVGTALANTNGLEPGNTWSYDALGIASNVSTFKAINLTGY